MKKLFLLLSLVLPMVASGEEKQDTTFRVNNRLIVVSDTIDRVRVQVYDTLGNALSKAFETEYVDGQQVERIYVGSPFIPKPKNQKFEGTLPAIFFGYQDLTTGFSDKHHSSDLHTKGSRSYELGITLIDLTQPLNKRNTFGLQYGLQFRVGYKGLDRDVSLDSPGVFTPYSGEKMHKNYLKWSSVSLPVLFDYQDQYKRHNFYLGIGLSVEWRHNLKSKYVVNTTDHGHYSVRSRIPMNPWGLNLEYHIGYGNVQFYMRSALTPFLKLQNGIHGYPCSMGIGIGI